MLAKYTTPSQCIAPTQKIYFQRYSITSRSIYRQSQRHSFSTVVLHHHIIGVQLKQEQQEVHKGSRAVVGSSCISNIFTKFLICFPGLFFLQVRGASTRVRCPLPECNGYLEEGSVVSRLSSEDLVRYRYFVELSQLDSSTKPCPQCRTFTMLKEQPPGRSEHKYKVSAAVL